MAYWVKQGDYYHYFRRVPARLKKYDRRAFVKVSLDTTDEAEADKRALIQNQVVENYWNELVSTKRVHGEDDAWHDAVALAKAHGFSYKSLQSLVDKATMQEIGQRLFNLKEEGITPRAANALAGGAGDKVLRLSTALDEYFLNTRDQMIGKSDDAVKKWKNPRKRAVRHFISGVGDLDTAKIERKEILLFRSWLLDRIADEEIIASTANKDFVHLKDVLRVTFLQNQIERDVDLMFTGVRFKGGQNSRQPYEASFVRDTILKPGALDGLNEEARAVVYMMADSGAGPSELIGLLPEEGDIVLDAKIPYMWIRPNRKRTLKTKVRPRQIPLVGFALKGAQMVPKGFPRYEIADSVSGAINKYFRARGWQLTPDHTLYSLRHTFKDRLRDAGTPDSVIDGLMGHAEKGEKYGRGHTLETKLEWLKKIAFKD